MSEALKPEVAADLARLLDEFGSLGVRPVHSEYSAESFGNYFVVFSSSKGEFRVVRDRSQYMVDGDTEELRQAGLWRAFDDKKELEDAVLSWLRGA